MGPGLVLKIVAVLGALAVGLGAFGAHGLKGRVEAGTLDPLLLEAFKTGVQYHFYHTLALLAVGCAGTGLLSGRCATIAVAAWMVGIVLFSGSLYLMTFTGARWLGAVTPLGGVAFIVGWVALFIAAYPKQSS